MNIDAILIVIDGKVYRAKKEWPMIVEGEIVKSPADAVEWLEYMPELFATILAACFDEVESDWNEVDFGDGSGNNPAFTLDRLTGKA